MEPFEKKEIFSTQLTTSFLQDQQVIQNGDYTTQQLQLLLHETKKQYQRGDYTKAELLYQKVIKYSKHLYKIHPNEKTAVLLQELSVVLFNLGTEYNHSKNHQKAEQCLIKSLEIAKKAQFIKQAQLEDWSYWKIVLRQFCIALRGSGQNRVAQKLERELQEYFSEEQEEEIENEVQFIQQQPVSSEGQQIIQVTSNSNKNQKETCESEAKICQSSKVLRQPSQEINTLLLGGNDEKIPIESIRLYLPYESTFDISQQNQQTNQSIIKVYPRVLPICIDNSEQKKVELMESKCSQSIFDNIQNGTNQLQKIQQKIKKCYYNRKHDEAIIYSHYCLKWSIRLFSRQPNFKTAEILNQLGANYFAQKQNEKSKKCFDSSLDVANLKQQKNSKEQMMQKKLQDWQHYQSVWNNLAIVKQVNKDDYHQYMAAQKMKRMLMKEE